MIVLCVDQAAVSGWCIISPGVLTQYSVRDHGTARTCGARSSVFVQLLALMRQHRLSISDVRVVLEDHSKVPTFATRGRASSAGMFIGMGKAYGRWEEQALLAGVYGNHIHSVAPATWRSVVLGSSKGGDVARAAAKERARMLLGSDVGEDEAEAVCIGVYSAQHMDRIIAGLGAPKRERKKRRKAAA